MADHKQIVFKISNRFGFDSETVKIPCLPSALSVNKVETRNKWQNVQINVNFRKGMKFVGKQSSTFPKNFTGFILLPSRTSKCFRF